VKKKAYSLQRSSEKRKKILREEIRQGTKKRMTRKTEKEKDRKIQG
jgi:hypothetical protein